VQRDADHAARDLLKRALDLSENLKIDERKAIERNLTDRLKKYSELESVQTA
jgi:hypothetical protein